MNDEKIKSFFLCRSQLAYENGCLMRGHRAVIPESLRQQVLNELHTSHLGIVRTKAEARSRLWFPGIDEAIEKMIGSCDTCIQLRPSPPRVSICPWPHPPQAFYRLHLDFLGPINGRMFLIIVDAFSKWVEVYEMNNCTSAALIEKMYEFMSRFGLPHTLVSDNGTAFCSQDFKNFCSLNGISHMTSPPYHPASNGQAEIYVKLVKKGIKSSILSSKNVRDSKLNLLKYMFDYRNSIHSLTNTSPAQLVFGRNLRSRLDLMHPYTAPPAPSATSLADAVKSKQCSQVQALRGKNTVFSIGQCVLYKRYINKDKFCWCKGVILRNLGQRLYVIKDCLTSNIIKKHKNQIVLYKGEDNNIQLWDDIGPFSFDKDISNAQVIASPITSLPDVDDSNVRTSEEEETDSSPNWVTTTRGVRRRASTDDGLSTYSRSGEDGQQELPPSPSWVMTKRGGHCPVESDEGEDFYEAINDGTSAEISQTK